MMAAVAVKIRSALAGEPPVARVERQRLTARFALAARIRLFERD